MSHKLKQCDTCHTMKLCNGTTCKRCKEAKSTQQNTTEEFPKGKEAYCPRCYFEDEKTVLREECPHNSSSNEPKSECFGEMVICEYCKKPYCNGCFAKCPNYDSTHPSQSPVSDMSHSSTNGTCTVSSDSWERQEKIEFYLRFITEYGFKLNTTPKMIADYWIDRISHAITQAVESERERCLKAHSSQIPFLVQRAKAERDGEWIEMMRKLDKSTEFLSQEIVIVTIKATLEKLKKEMGIIS